MNAFNPIAQAGLDQLSDKHFSAIAATVEACAGIKLPKSKRTMVEGRLRKRVRALGLGGLKEYCAHLFERGGLDNELSELIDCVTTNKTDFFREPMHFEFMRDVIIDEMSRLQGVRAPSLKIWSAACSTGAEAYTVAMVLEDMVAAGAVKRYAVLGTDISADVLREAEEGIYPLEFVRPVPIAMQRRYLMRSRDAASPFVRVVPELRKKVSFQHLNLMDASYPFDRDVDVVICRNVLIYFEKHIQTAVVTRLVSHLRPGGFLVLGHSESMAGGGVESLIQIKPTIFQRSGES